MSSGPHIEPASAPKRRLKGGNHTVRLFSRLFGLSRLRLPFRIETVVWNQDRFEATVRTAGGGRVTVCVDRLDPRNPARDFITTPHLSVWYQADELPPALETLLRKASETWRDVTIEELLNRMRQDPELTELEEQKTGPPDVETPDVEAEPDRRSPDVPEQSKVCVGTWDVENAYADFFAMEALELLPYEPIEASNPFIRISHSDLECHSFMPREKASNLNLVDFPWIDRIGATRTLLKDPALETTFSTDLTERDVIMGSNPRVREVLDHALDHATARDAPGPIIFTNTCLPATTSEDVMSVVKQYQQKSPVPLICHNRAAIDFDADMLGEALVDRRLKAQTAVSDSDRDLSSVNLVGFPRDRSLDELVRLLDDLGIPVNTVVLPALDPADMDRFPRAGLNVFQHATHFWDRYYDQLQDQSTVPSLFPEGPYGVDGTRRWLEAVAEAIRPGASLDPGTALEEVFKEHFSKIKEKWDRMTAEAGKHTLGFVVRPRDIPYLRDPSYTNGVPLISVLEDMGFNLEALLLSAEEKRDDLVPQVNALFKNPDRHNCLTFEGFAEMRRALSESRARAVFSNYCFDWRLTEAGKNRISLSCFEKGIAGAARTLRRLLNACAAPFYRNYSRYLRRTPMGLLPEPTGGS